MSRFHSVCIITSEVRELREFYERVLGTTAQGDDSFVEFPREGLGLALYSRAGMERMAPGSSQCAGYGGVVLEFEVSDVDEEYRRLLELGVSIAKPPSTQDWGLRSVWFRDPVGNLINFFAPVKPQADFPQNI
jgi:catechol 2,3-dioxygenase-like lactoylglutathione lyase family enzyme